MNSRHHRVRYDVIGEGVLSEHPTPAPTPKAGAEATDAATDPTSPDDEPDGAPGPRFSRLGPTGSPVDVEVLRLLARTMTAAPTAETPHPDAEGMPAGYTYLGQFVDHDLTLDLTPAAFGDPITDEDLRQGRTPTLDLDCLYGAGPWDARDDRLYVANPSDPHDHALLALGVTAPISPGEGPADEGTERALAGYDLPRVANGPDRATRQQAAIPDVRNDENLIVAQTHLAFMRFHNRVVADVRARGVRGPAVFTRARWRVTMHYQWMLWHDFLPRMVDPAILDDVAAKGRTFVEPNAQGRGPATMPLEFSVAAYRIGHSMVRAAYSWNRIFTRDGGGGTATLGLLFRFSGTSGGFVGDFEQLPTNWAVDFRRLYDFREAGRPDLAPPDGVNPAKRIDTHVADPLASLPPGSFGGTEPPADPDELNLAFRNLVRANMVRLASGQQMAELMGEVPLSREQILQGDGRGVRLPAKGEAADRFAAATPLWFYVLREAELADGRLSGVGGRIVAEVFHRAMENSRHSIVRTPGFRPDLGPDRSTFRMVDLLLHAFDEGAGVNPLGDEAVVPEGTQAAEGDDGELIAS